MRYVFIAFALLFIAVFYFGYRDAQVQHGRNLEQAALLAQLEALHTSPSSQLVDELRVAFPSPSDSDVTDLRILVERVKADPASAAKYTVEGKRQAMHASGFDQIRTVFGNSPADDVKPGI